jgi:DNA-binding CsgD family transcriptional regulator
MLQICADLLAPAFELRTEWEYGLHDVVSAQIMALLMEGRLHEVAPILELSEGFVDADRDPSAFGFIHLGWARLALFRGEPATAVSRLRQAFAGFTYLDHGVRGPWGLRLLAEALALTGDLPGAEHALTDARATDGELRNPFAADGARAEAWVAVAAGEHDRARAQLLAEADTARQLGQFGYEALLLHDVARLDDAGTVTARLHELAGTVDGPIVPAFAAHAAALVTRDADALERVSVEFETLGFLLIAAEASAAAAAVHREAGLLARASTALARVSALRSRCEGARTPALAADPEVVALTRREREVATLAAQGMASKEIAGTLHLSSRTVDNHLQKAYDKLGVRRREELAEVLGLEK